MCRFSRALVDSDRGRAYPSGRKCVDHRRLHIATSREGRRSGRASGPAGRARRPGSSGWARDDAPARCSMMQVVSITGLPSSTSSGKLPERRVPLELVEILRMVLVEHSILERSFVGPQRDQDLLGVGRERVPEELEAHQAPSFDLLARLELGLARLLGRERAGLDLSRRLVGGEDRRPCPRRNDRQASARRALSDPSKIRLPSPKHDRESHQDQLVDQAGRKQRRIERAAALDEQVAALALA